MSVAMWVGSWVLLFPISLFTATVMVDQCEEQVRPPEVGIYSFTPGILCFFSFTNIFTAAFGQYGSSCHTPAPDDVISHCLYHSHVFFRLKSCKRSCTIPLPRFPSIEAARVHDIPLLLHHFFYHGFLEEFFLAPYLKFVPLNAWKPWKTVVDAD